MQTINFTDDVSIQQVSAVKWNVIVCGSVVFIARGFNSAKKTAAVHIDRIANADARNSLVIDKAPFARDVMTMPAQSRR